MNAADQETGAEAAALPGSHLALAPRESRALHCPRHQTTAPKIFYTVRRNEHPACKCRFCAKRTRHLQVPGTQSTSAYNPHAATTVWNIRTCTCSCEGICRQAIATAHLTIHPSATKQTQNQRSIAKDCTTLVNVGFGRIIFDLQFVHIRCPANMDHFQTISRNAQMGQLVPATRGSSCCRLL